MNAKIIHVISVSGGADSTALALVAGNINSEIGGLKGFLISLGFLILASICCACVTFMVEEKLAVSEGEI